MIRIPTKDGMFTNYVGGFYCDETIYLSESDDLNNCTLCNKRYSWIANTYPLNCPGSGFTMFVIATNWGCTQVAISYVKETLIYVRSHFLGDWGAWKQIC